MKNVFFKNTMIRFIFTFLFVLLFFPSSVSAVRLVTYGEFTTGTTYSPSGYCSGSSYVCWNPDGWHNGFFRMTLIDGRTGKKVENTRSVNISGNSFYNVDGNFKLYGYRSISTPIGINNVDYFSYKFGDETDFSVSSGDQLAIIYDSRFPYGASDYYIFRNLLDDTSDADIDCDDPVIRAKSCFKYGDRAAMFSESDSNYYNFLEFFYLSSGYLHVDDSIATYDSRMVTAQDHYFVVTEPVFPMWWQEGGTKYRYGTITEWAKYIQNNPNSLVATTHRWNLFSNTSLCISKQADLDSLEKSGLNVDGLGLQVSGLCNNSNTSTNDIINKLYGVMITSISDAPTEKKCIPCTAGCPCPPPPDKLKIEYDACDLDNGKISLFYSESDIKKISDSPQIIMNDDLKVSGADSAAIYCFDNVEYDFSDTISDLSSKDLLRISFVKPRNSKINVERYCLVGSTADYNPTIIKENIKREYADSQFKLKYYKGGSDENNNGIYNYKPTLDSESLSGFNVEYDVLKTYTDGSKFVKYVFSLEFDIPDNQIFIGSKSGRYSGTIELTDWTKSFGLSNKLINSTNTSFNVSELYNNLPTEDSMKCHFNYEVPANKSNISFRVIALDNPFPGRDGSSRMPVGNWLNTENNVFNYIINNRGIRAEYVKNNPSFAQEVTSANIVDKYNSISPEEMYNQMEPMYRIVLTPATMTKIRSYNQGFSYYSMYDTDYSEIDAGVNEYTRRNDKSALKLKCNEIGRECYSQFLRYYYYLSQDDDTLSGSCVLIKNIDVNDDANTLNGDAAVRNTFNEYTGELFIKEELNILNEYFYTAVSEDEEGPTEYKTIGEIYDRLRRWDDENGYYRFDINKNGWFDSDDLDLIYSYLSNKYSGQAQLNNQFYTCANKTFKSGGPDERRIN